MSDLTTIAVLGLTAILSSSAESPGQNAGQDDAMQEERGEPLTTREEKARPVTEFTDDDADWRTVNDVVMGGVSSSRFYIEKGMGVFEGNVSLENNGGFASVRSLPSDHDLSWANGLLLRVRGDGKRYAFRLRMAEGLDGISYQVRFETKAGEWTTVEAPFDAFRPVFRGRLVKGADPLDPGAVKTFGFLISDKQAGPFRLEIDWIRAYEPRHEDTEE